MMNDYAQIDYDNFISLNVADFISKRLLKYVLICGYVNPMEYYKHWQAKRYLETMYTVGNWYLNNVIN